MAAKKKAILSSGVDDNGLAWQDEDIFGTTFRFREVTVQESDDAYDASLNEDKTFNQRLNQRLLLVSSIVSPKVAVDDIGKWGIRKLIAMLDAYDRINALPAADIEGNG